MAAMHMPLGCGAPPLLGNTCGPPKFTGKEGSTPAPDWYHQGKKLLLPALGQTCKTATALHTQFVLRLSKAMDI